MVFLKVINETTLAIFFITVEGFSFLQSYAEAKEHRVIFQKVVYDGAASQYTLGHSRKFPVILRLNVTLFSMIA